MTDIETKWNGLEKEYDGNSISTEYCGENIINSKKLGYEKAEN